MRPISLKDGLSLASRKMSAKEAVPNAEELVLPIDLEGSKKERQKLTHIVNEMCKSAAGCSILIAASQAGYSLSFDEDLVEEGQYGYADPGELICALNPQNTVEESIVTMAHELRHAFQFEHEITDRISVQSHETKTVMHLDRIMEADAEGYGCLVAWELKEAGLPDTWNDFSGEFPEVASPFEKALQEDKGMKMARTAAFLGWYDNDERRDSYDRTHLATLKSFKPKEINKRLKSVSAGEIIDTLCQDPDSNGEGYFMMNTMMLESGKYVTVYNRVKNGFKKFFDERSKIKGAMPDKSLEQLISTPEPRNKNKGLAVSENAKVTAFTALQKKALATLHEKRKVAAFKKLSKKMLTNGGR